MAAANVRNGGGGNASNSSSSGGGRGAKSLDERLVEQNAKWCRYCGTTTPVHWRGGPWGPNTLCKYGRAWGAARRAGRARGGTSADRGAGGG